MQQGHGQDSLPPCNILVSSSMVKGWLLAAIFLVVVCHGEAQERGNISASRKFYPEVAPVKTIQSKEGDVIDCVEIYRQPSLAHPLLKNHKIQVKQTGVDGELVESRNSSVGRLSQPWHAQSGGCPDGSVPIARPHNSNNTVAHPGAPLIRHPHQFHVDSEPSPSGVSHEYALVRGNPLHDRDIHGGVAEWSVWSPHVDSEDEFSAARIQVIKGSGSAAEWISAGWMVNLKRYPSGDPRLFAFFESNIKTGCYDAGCGFVQVSKKTCLGASFLSSVRGSTAITPLLVKIHLADKLWKLFVNGDYVGYWPAEFFKHLRSGATSVNFGGEVLNSWPAGLHSRTEMGNGQFPKEHKSKYNQVACFKRFEYINAEDKTKSFWKWKKKLDVNRENCYAATLKSGEGGFCYGGPGYNENCKRRD